MPRAPRSAAPGISVELSERDTRSGSTSRIRGEAPRAAGAQQADALPDSGFDLEAHVKQIERDYIAQALLRTGGVQVKAADLLGMSFRSFRYYVKKYNLR